MDHPSVLRVSSALEIMCKFIKEIRIKFRELLYFHIPLQSLIMGIGRKDRPSGHTIRVSFGVPLQAILFELSPERRLVDAQFPSC